MQAPLEKEKQRHHRRKAAQKRRLGDRLWGAIQGFIILAVILSFTFRAYSWEYRFSGEINDYVSIEKNYSNISYLYLPYIDFYNEDTKILIFHGTQVNKDDFDYDDTYNVLSFSPEFHFSPRKGINGSIRTDLSWLHTWNEDIDEKDEIELFSAYLNMTSKRLTLQLGLLPFYIGNGLILNDSEPGLTLDYRAKKNLYFSLNTALTRETSPLTSLSVGYIPGFLEKIELFAAWFHDDDNAFTVTINQSTYYRRYYLNDVKNRGDLFWYGLLADLFVGDIFLSLAAIGQYGIFYLDHTLYYFKYDINLNELSIIRAIEGETEFILPAYVIDIKASYNITDWLTLGAFFFLSPGDASIQQGKRQQLLTTFLSPAPYLPRSDIFFNGGVNGGNNPEALYNVGFQRCRVIAPGLELYLQPRENISTEITFSGFFPQDNPFNKFRWYGLETDVNINYSWKDKHHLFFQAALFQHADFIEYYQKLLNLSAQDIELEPIVRFMIGYTIMF